MDLQPHQARVHATMEDEARARLCADPAGYRRAPSLITADTAAQWMQDAIHYENGHLIVWIGDNYPSRVLAPQGVILKACLEGRPAILRHLTEVKYCLSVSSAILGVARYQSPQLARQIFSAMVPGITLEELRELVIEVCKEDEYWLMRSFDESYEITAANVAHGDACRMLGIVCENGNLELAVWLASRFEFGTRDIARKWLHNVCSEGHMHIMKWLTDRFRLTAAHIREYNVFFDVCWSGDLDFVRWTVRRFGLTARDARKDNHHILWSMCVTHQVRVAAWIITHFGLGRPGSNLSLVTLMRYAVTDTQYLRIIRLVEKTQSIRLGTRQCNHTVRTAIRRAHINVLRWVAHRYGLMREDTAARLALPAWLDRIWRESVRDAVWTEAGEVIAVQWPGAAVRNRR